MCKFLHQPFRLELTPCLDSIHSSPRLITSKKIPSSSSVHVVYPHATVLHRIALQIVLQGREPRTNGIVGAIHHSSVPQKVALEVLEEVPRHQDEHHHQRTRAKLPRVPKHDKCHKHQILYRKYHPVNSFHTLTHFHSPFASDP